MKRSDFFGKSKYLKAADLQGKPVVLEIESAVAEPIKGSDGETQTKCVLHFVGTGKVLPLNATNFDAIEDIANNEDTDAWPGTRIELYPTQTDLRGQTVDCIRIRAPQQQDLALAAQGGARVRPAAPDIDDEIPF